MRKQQAITSLLFICIASLSMAETKKLSEASTWQEAKTKAKVEKKDILLYVYGSNWNRLSLKFKKQIWDTPAFKASIADQVIALSVDYLDTPTDEQKKSFHTKMRGFEMKRGKLKFTSYPVLALYDASGREIEVWSGSRFPLMSSLAVSVIKDATKRRRERDRLLEEAKGLQGEKKAEVLYSAIELHAGMKNEIIQQMKRCDPADESGYRGMLQFDGRKAMHRVNVLVKAKKYKEAIDWLEEQWKKPKLTIEQKQWILAAKGNVYRRWGKGHRDEMVQAWREAYELDPKSVPGRACFRLGKKLAPQKMQKIK